jgi:hypothetical protein
MSRLPWIAALVLASMRLERSGVLLAFEIVF